MIVAMRTDFASAALESLRWPSSQVRKMAKLFYDRRCVNRPHNEVVLVGWIYILKMKWLAEKATTDQVLAYHDGLARDVFGAAYQPSDRTQEERDQLATTHRESSRVYYRRVLALFRARTRDQHERHAENAAWLETPGAAYVARRRKEQRDSLRKALQRSP